MTRAIVVRAAMITAVLIAISACATEVRVDASRGTAAPAVAPESGPEGCSLPQPAERVKSEGAEPEPSPIANPIVPWDRSSTWVEVPWELFGNTVEVSTLPNSERSGAPSPEMRNTRINQASGPTIDALAKPEMAGKVAAYGRKGDRVSIPVQDSPALGQPVVPFVALASPDGKVTLVDACSNVAQLFHQFAASKGQQEAETLSRFTDPNTRRQAVSELRAFVKAGQPSPVSWEERPANQRSYFDPDAPRIGLVGFSVDFNLKGWDGATTVCLRTAKARIACTKIDPQDKERIPRIVGLAEPGAEVTIYLMNGPDIGRIDAEMVRPRASLKVEANASQRPQSNQPDAVVVSAS